MGLRGTHERGFIGSAAMHARVLFTKNYSSGSDIAATGTNERRKLYSRIRITNLDESIENLLLEDVNLVDDPMMSFINRNLRNDETAISEEYGSQYDTFKNGIIWVDILGFEDDDFVQFRGRIDSDVIKRVAQAGIAQGIELKQLHTWIYGLLIDGKYDNSNYEFVFVKVEDDFFWLIEILHHGLFKILSKIKVERQSNIDIDEFFIEDLQQFYDRSIEHRAKEESWNIQKGIYLKEIKMLNDKKEIDRLSNSVRLMKSRIRNYFLPLINSLLDDKRDSVEKMNNLGDMLFSSKRKQNVSVLGDIELKAEKKENQRQNSASEIDELDWIQGERHKRMRGNLNDSIHVKRPKYFESPLKKSDSDDSFKFNGRERGSINEKELDSMPTIKLAEGKKDSAGFLLDEETQVDVKTDISSIEDNNCTERSEEVTEISDS